jgi:hypothetical protein
MRPLTLGEVSAIQRVRTSCVGRSGGTICTASPVTVPLVEGVHARTSPTRLSLTGDVMNPEKRSFNHPGCPKSHGSSRPLVSPHSVICLIAHSPAAL